jgi:serine/threonine-protein kinase RsbW
MHITMSLQLPRDEISVPVARHLTVGAMTQLGVEPQCAADIEVALTEACTNVILHSGPGDLYEVSVEVDDSTCVIRVLDRGHGFDAAGLSTTPADGAAESGRGVALMEALVDQVLFESRPEAGTVVHLEKTLDYHEGSVMRRLASEEA